MSLLQHWERHPYLKWGFGLFSLILLTVGCGVAVFTANHHIVAGVSIGETTAGGLERPQVVAALQRRLEPALARQIVLTYQKRNIYLTLGSLGIQPDYQATVEKAYRIGRTGPLWRQAAVRWQIRRQGMAIPILFKNNRDTWLAFYRLLEATLAIEPVRSVVKVNLAGEVSYSLSKKGRVIAAAALLKRLEEAVTNSRIVDIAIPVETETPPLTEAEIRSWSLDRLLGLFYTEFNPALTDRVHNLQMACSALDNTLVYPGQKFSFNTWVGPRVPEAGYREAPVIFMGKLVAGVGGGICQVSSTLYNAVLLANLKVVERYNHSLPSTYVPLARDATLVDGGLDFVFENTNRKPVLITARVEAPYVIVAILGEKTGWEKVELETVVAKTFPFGIKEIPDPALTVGERMKAQDGKLGFKAELWRTVTLPDGSTRKMRVNTSIYPAQPEEYKVGTNPLPEL